MAALQNIALEPFQPLQTVAKNDSALHRKAQAKSFSYGTLRNMIGLNSPLKKEYIRALNCSNTIAQYTTTDGTTVTKSKYCKSRSCIVCNRIRTAQFINEYSGLLATWSNAHFVTLTIPHTRDSDLKELLETMHGVWRSMFQTRAARRIGLSGVKKIEVTHGANGYHPHFHIIVKDRVQAEFIQAYWLEHINGANLKAQDIRAVHSLDSLKELAKYLTKFGSVTGNTKDGKSYAVDYVATDHILQALHGKRTLDSFGEARKGRAKYEPIKLELQQLEAVYSYEPKEYTWIEKETGEVLVSYTPSKLIQALNTLPAPVKHLRYDYQTGAVNGNVTVTATDNVTVTPLHATQTAKVEYTTTTTTNAIQGNLSPNTPAHTGHGITQYLPYRGAKYLPPPAPPPLIHPPKLE